jgi:phosphoribosylglycinamide formyltransferase-1
LVLLCVRIKEMKNIAIFASGSGSNAEKIMEYFENSKEVKVVLVLSDNPNAGVLLRANKFEIETKIISRLELKSPKKALIELKTKGINFIVLAGFLRKIPREMIQEFPNQIINIHPALLPKYGGMGMYGLNVHRAVKDSGDVISGPTIHLVNEEYDKGQILFQKEIKIEPEDNAKQIAEKVLSVEHEEYPRVIENYMIEYYKRA